MSQSARPDPLQPALEKAEAELAKHLDEACETQNGEIGQGSVEELMRLEEELLAAARAADEAVRLRRRLDQRGSADRAATAATPARQESAPAAAPVEAGGRVREFRDRKGHAWRVWEVRPGIGRPLRDLHRHLGEYLNGWLAFGCLDNDSRKRLPKYPPDWFEMSDQELEALLHAAKEVPPRKKAG